MSLDTLLGMASSANGRSSRGRTPVYRLMVGGVEVDYTVTDASFTFGAGLHDQCTMSVSSADLTTTEGLLESAISFLFGSAPRSDVFSGYITEVSESKKSAGSLSWEMTITGVTKTMQTSTPRFWAKTTIPSAVQSLAYAGGLGFTTHPHTYVWDSLAQAGQTDWAAAAALAEELGWSVFTRYGVVMLHSPLTLFKESGPAATLVSESYNVAQTMVDPERTLLDFIPNEESKSAVVKQGTKVAYFHNDLLQTAPQPGSFPSYRFITDTIIDNPVEAQIYTEAPSHNPSSWLQAAAARVLGNAQLYPGLCVDVLTTNTSYYPGKFNGRWFITALQHKMDKQQFQTNLLLARPDSKTQVYTGAYVPFWQQDHRARPTLTLINGKWVSSWTSPGSGSAN